MPEICSTEEASEVQAAALGKIQKFKGYTKIHPFWRNWVGFSMFSSLDDSSTTILTVRLRSLQIKSAG